eukprot:NODE_691_length_4696_cov_0.623885.p1 type:complete len:469 gc:universal NODE_691_length_4696_cov_0.623885:429-1835(+)
MFLAIWILFGASYTGYSEAGRHRNLELYLYMVERNDIQPISEKASRAKYFGIFENPGELNINIINSNPAWPVLALYYAGKWAQEGNQELNLVCRLVIYSCEELGHEFDQIFFHNVMIELYDKVSESHPNKIHDLMLDFAVYFFVNRPLNRDAQKQAFLEISDKYGYPQIGSRFTHYLDQVSTPYYDRFATLFKNPNLTANYPQEIKSRIKDYLNLNYEDQVEISLVKYENDQDPKRKLDDSYNAAFQSTRIMLRKIDFLFKHALLELRDSNSLRDIYFKLFGNSHFKSDKIVNLELAWVPNSLFYAGEYIRENLNRLTPKEINTFGRNVIKSFQKLEPSLTQNSVYIVVMLQLFDRVRHEFFKALPELFKDFAIDFFVNRPTTRHFQIQAIQKLVRKWLTKVQIIDELELPKEVSNLFCDYSATRYQIPSHLFCLKENIIYYEFVVYFDDYQVIQMLADELKTLKMPY